MSSKLSGCSLEKHMSQLEIDIKRAEKSIRRSTKSLSLPVIPINKDAIPVLSKRRSQLLPHENDASKSISFEELFSVGYGESCIPTAETDADIKNVDRKVKFLPYEERGKTPLSRKKSSSVDDLTRDKGEKKDADDLERERIVSSLDLAQAENREVLPSINVDNGGLGNSNGGLGSSSSRLSIPMISSSQRSRSFDNLMHNKTPPLASLLDANKEHGKGLLRNCSSWNDITSTETNDSELEQHRDWNQDPKEQNGGNSHDWASSRLKKSSSLVTPGTPSEHRASALSRHHTLPANLPPIHPLPIITIDQSELKSINATWSDEEAALNEKNKVKGNYSRYARHERSQSLTALSFPRRNDTRNFCVRFDNPRAIIEEAILKHKGFCSTNIKLKKKKGEGVKKADISDKSEKNSDGPQKSLQPLAVPASSDFEETYFED